MTRTQIQKLFEQNEKDTFNLCLTNSKYTKISFCNCCIRNVFVFWRAFINKTECF